jgi:DNA-binding transcriptional LysR family regulator
MIPTPPLAVQYPIRIQLFTRMGPGNRPLDLDWLEDFLTLADTGNFSRAAQARAIAQPAFSRHIRALEEWAGVELVDRSAHPVTLTVGGASLRPVVEEVLQRLDTARRNARAAQEQAGLSLQLAATHVLSMTFFPAWLGRLEAHVQIGAIQMVSDSFRACEDLMLQRRVQFLLCHGHPAAPTRLEPAAFASMRVDDDVLMPVAAPRANGGAAFGLAPAVPDTPLPVLAYSQESGLGQIMRATLPGAFDPARFRPVFTSHHAVLLKTMAMEGRGIAWLPRSLIAQELALGQLVEAGDAGWSTPLEIRLVRPRDLLPPAAEALWARVAAGSGAPS